MDITLTLTVEEVGFLLAALNELPTKTGAFALVAKINSQAQPQVPPPPAPEQTTEETK